MKFNFKKVSVQDACPVREKPQVHQAVRNLLKKMNIDIVETEFCGTRSICCGDNFYPSRELTKNAKDIIDKYFTDIDELEKQIQKYVFFLFEL